MSTPSRARAPSPPPTPGVDESRRQSLLRTFDQTAAELLFLGMEGAALWARIRVLEGGRDNVIKVNNVVKTFDGFRALDGLTMTVEKGLHLRPGGAQRGGQIHHSAPYHRRLPPRFRLCAGGRPAGVCKIRR